MPPLMPPISQANPLPPSYDSNASSSPVSFRNSSTSPSTSRQSLRPYADASYEDALLHAATTDDGIAASFVAAPTRKNAEQDSRSNTQAHVSTASTTSALAGRGLHRRTATTAALPSAITLQNSRTQPSAFGATVASSSSLPNLASASTSPKTPRRKETEQVGTILLGEAGEVVGRAWGQEKEKERRKSDRRRIEELEEEVKRLRGQVRFTGQLASPPVRADEVHPFSSRHRNRLGRPSQTRHE